MAVETGARVQGIVVPFASIRGGSGVSGRTGQRTRGRVAASGGLWGIQGAPSIGRWSMFLSGTNIRMSAAGSGMTSGMRNRVLPARGVLWEPWGVPSVLVERWEQ
jgi:hypothetical protein